MTATKPLVNAAAPPLVDEALSRAPVGPASHVWGSQGARASTMDRRIQKHAGSIGIACAGWDCRAGFARRQVSFEATRNISKIRSLLKLTICRCSARFQRSQRNPSVGYDTKRKKFTVMVVENGVDAPKGSFRAEEEAVEVCTFCKTDQKSAMHPIKGP